MKNTNYLDILPVELHLYINDIINSDRRFHDWEKAVKHLEDNLIHDLFFKQNLLVIHLQKVFFMCPCKRCQSSYF